MILITGATGTVGSEVMKQLRERGIPIRAAVHTTDSFEVCHGLGIEMVGFDFDRPETWEPALKDCDKVLFIGVPKPGFAELSYQFATSARKAGVNHLVKLSTYGANDPEKFLLGKLHHESEKAIEKSKINFTHVRPNLVMQHYINPWGSTIVSEGKFYLAQGVARLSLIDARDIARATVEVLLRSGYENKVISLTGTEAITHFEAAKQISIVLGKQVSYVSITREESLKRLRDRKVSGFWIETSLNLDEFARAGGFQTVTHSFSKLTGKDPIKFIDFAKDHLKDFYSRRISA